MPLQNLSLQNLSLLKTLCAIHAPSGHERPVRDFLIDYIKAHRDTWKVKPKLIYGKGFQDCLIVEFGRPRTALFAHMDTVGFSVGPQLSNPTRSDAKYRLIEIGAPLEPFPPKVPLVGEDLHQNPIETTLLRASGYAGYFPKETDPLGGSLTYAPHFFHKGDLITSPSLDNRLGVFCALEIAKTLKDGALVFSTYEEHGGGSVGFLSEFLHKTYGISQALISDVTWEAHHVKLGQGAVISLRDSCLPRAKFLKKIRRLAKDSGTPYQLEVAEEGGSDGSEIQTSPLPIDWCFLGAPQKHPHSPQETVHTQDITSMINLTSYLLKKL
jgi:putative aminopeptidase FrvX